MAFGWRSLLDWWVPDAAGVVDEQATQKARHDRLALAYRRVFDVSGEDAQLVIADLAEITGYFRVNGPGLTSEERAYSDGQRSAFVRIFFMSSMADEKRVTLYKHLMGSPEPIAENEEPAPY